MSLADFQRALADMTLDAGLAVEVRSRGSSALAGYALTETEGRRLQAVAQQDGMSLNCSLARANRFTSIHDAFSMTCLLLGPQLRSVLDQLWSARRPGNYQLTGEEMVFADIVEAAVTCHLLSVEYLGEILRYERACWEMAMELRLKDASQMEGQSRKTRFEHDPGVLIDALSKNELPPSGLPRCEFEVTIRVVHGELVAQWDAPASGPIEAD